MYGRVAHVTIARAHAPHGDIDAQGPDRFNAIINPPQSAILAVGRQRDCVVARCQGGAHARIHPAAEQNHRALGWPRHDPIITMETIL